MEIGTTLDIDRINVGVIVAEHPILYGILKRIMGDAWRKKESPFYLEYDDPGVNTEEKVSKKY